jgi:hypothetical protein
MNRREFLKFLTTSSIMIGGGVGLCSQCISNQIEHIEKMSDEEFISRMFDMDHYGKDDLELKKYIEKSGYTVDGCSLNSVDLGQQCTSITMCTGSCRLKEKMFANQNLMKSLCE